MPSHIHANRRVRTWLGSLGLVLIGAIGGADYWTGPVLSLGLFYLLPIAWAGWSGGRRHAVALAVLGACAWLAADWTTTHPHHPLLVHLWNAGTRLGIFLSVALLVSALRTRQVFLADLVRRRTIQLENEIARQRQTEHELRASEAKYRTLVEQLPAITYAAALDEHSTTLYVSPQVEAMLGFSQAEYQANPDIWRSRLHPDDRESVLAKVRRSQATGQPLACEYRLIHRDGRATWFRDEAVIVRDTAGKPLFLQGVMFDVTERHRAEAALRTYHELIVQLGAISDLSEALRRVLQTALSLGIADCGGIHLLNQATGELELTVHQGLSPAFARLIAHEGVDTPRVSRIMAGQAIYVGRDQIALDLLELEPALRTICAIPFSDKGAIVGSLNLASRTADSFPEEHRQLVETIAAGIGPVVARIQAEEELRRSEARIRALFEAMPDRIFRIGRDGTYRDFFSGSGPRPANWPAQFVGKKVADVFPAEFAELKMDIIERTFAQGGIQQIEYKFPCPDPEGKFHDLEGRYVVSGDDEVMAIIRDVTDRKEAEAKLLAYQRQLRKLASELSLAEERERRRLASELHDNVGQLLALAKIKLWAAGGTPAAGPLTGPLEEVGELLEDAIRQTRSVTFQLSPPILHELDFPAAVEWIAEQVRKQYGLRVELADDGRPKPLTDDLRIVLAQAVRELLVNVAKHAQTLQARVSLSRTDGAVRVEVQDDGVGFDPAQIGDSAFGLFSLRERLGHLGGQMVIDSRPGRGSRIELAAPLVSGQSTDEETC